MRADRAPAPGWLQIARLAVKEAARRRLLAAGVVLSALFVGLFALGYALVFRAAGDGLGEDPLGPVFAGSVLTSFGLYAVHFLAALLALLLSAGAVSSEVESGAALAVLARPLRRREWLLGRWAAFALLLTTYVVLMAGGLLLIARAISGYVPLSAPRGVALLVLEVLILLTLGMLGSSRWSTLTTGVGVFCLFGLAWLAGILEFVGRIVANATLVDVGIAVSLVIPADAIWRGASYYVQSPLFLLEVGGSGGIPFFGSAPPARPLLLWSVGYVAVCLLAAVRTFDRRDL